MSQKKVTFKLNHPTPCPSCGKKNENKWCYEMYSGDVLIACKRDNELDTNKKYKNTGNFDRDGTPLYIEMPEKKVSSQGTKTYIYYSYPHSTGKNPLVKVLRTDDGKGNKTFKQLSWINGQWVNGTSGIDKSNISLYNLEKLNESHKKTVFICEGEKVADEITKTGLLGICNLGGANKWRDHYSQILKDLDLKVVLVPDCDKPGVKSMKSIERDLVKMNLKTSWFIPFKGSKMWENLPKSHGLDFADWIKYVERFGVTSETINQLVENEFVCKESGNNDNSKDNYHKNKILYNLNDIFTQPTICVDDSIYMWNGTHYEYKRVGAVKHIIWNYLETTPVERMKDGKKILMLDPLPSDVEKIFSAACSKFYLDPDLIHNGGINCKNGLLKIDWSDKKNPKPVLVEHSPDQYYTYCSDVVYDPNANEDDLEKLLECLEPKYVKIFFQVIGVAIDFNNVRKLTGRTAKALLMSGFGSNGKDSLKTVLSLITKNIANVSLQDFKEYDSGRKFPLSRLKGSSVNWSSENSAVNLATLQSIKTAITGENLSYEKKGKDEDNMTCSAIHLFNVNEVPQISSLDAVLSRFTEIRFNKTYSPRPKNGELLADPRFRYDFEFLIEKVCPAFLNRMISGLVETVKEGIDYSPTDHLIEKMKEKTNHLWAFANDTKLQASDGEVTTKEIWAELKNWYLETGVLEIDNMGREVYYDNEKRKDAPVKSISQVKSRITALFPKVEVVSTRTAKERTTVLKGISFKKGDNGTKKYSKDLSALKNVSAETQNNISQKENENGNGNGNENGNGNGNITPNKNIDTSPKVENKNIDTSPKDNNLMVDSNNMKAEKSNGLVLNPQKYEENHEIIKPPNYPYNLTSLDKENNAVNVDESQIDIYYIKEKKRGLFNPYKIPDYSALNILYFDIETTGLEHSNEIIAIGLSDGQNNMLITRKVLTEKELLIKFFETIEERSKGLILVGHNIYNFDIPFIEARAISNNINTNIRFADKTSFITSSSVNGKPIEFTPMFWNPIQFVDTYHMLGSFDKSANKLTSYSLKRAVLQLKLRDEERLELDHKEILSEYKNNKWDNILEYLAYDLDDTKLLCDFLLPQIYYQLKVVPNINLQKIVLSSPALKWELILQEFYKYESNKPKADIKRQYEGGLVQVNPGYYENCGKIDVSGMYPSIQILYGLTSKKDLKGHYLDVLKYLTEERTVLKEKFKETKDSKYDAMQNAYKILNNGGYGFTGTTGYSFNCMETSALVTAYGRVIVKEMTKKMLEIGCKIIEVDTDGIYFSHPNQREVYEKVQEILPNGIKIDLEYEGVSIYCPAKKNYIIFNGDSVTVKGGNFKSRTKCSLLKKFTVDYLLSYRKSPEEAENYYEDLVKSLKSGEHNLEDLIVKQRIPKNNKALLPLGEVGDVIEYYWGGHVTQRGVVKNVPTQTKEYLPEYYIKEINALRSSIMEVLK